MAKSIGVITILVRTGWCSDQQTVLLIPLSCKRFQENVWLSTAKWSVTVKEGRTLSYYNDQPFMKLLK